MPGYLLDTNSVSEVVKPKRDAGFVDWFESIDESLIYLSVLTLGEIRKGIDRLPAGARRKRLEAWLLQDLRVRFEGRILGIDARIGDAWGALVAKAVRRGVAVSVIDGLLAATAIQHDLILVSRNHYDFRALPVSVLSPWRM